MKSIKLLVSIVAILAVVFAVASVSAFADVRSVEVNGVEAMNNAADIGVTAGDTLAVKVVVYAYENASDVTFKLWITGGKTYAATSESFDMIEGRTYSKLFAVKVPTNIDPQEDVYLYVDAEADNKEIADAAKIKLTAQRESYKVDFLDVVSNSKVQAGENLALDVVLKNRGSHFAEDTFVKATISALGVEERSYFGDMSPVDQSDPDKEDAAERRMYLSIPSNAKPGVYTLELEVYNGDASTTVVKKIAVVGASEDSMVVPSARSKTFASGEKATYSLTLVNSGNKIKVFDLSVENDNKELNVDVDESIVVVPAGSSKTVKVSATASKNGEYEFAVNVNSDEELVKKEIFTANVEGSSSSTSKAFSGNTAVVLTVVLAIIFVVLLIVLIVLLTRKPEKQELGESYY